MGGSRLLPGDTGIMKWITSAVTQILNKTPGKPENNCYHIVYLDWDDKGICPDSLS
jgi:hypothetical protein